MSECEWCNRGLPLNASGEHYRPQEQGAGKTLLCSTRARCRIADLESQLASTKAEVELYRAEMSAAKAVGFYSAQELFHAYQVQAEDITRLNESIRRYQLDR